MNKPDGKAPQQESGAFERANSISLGGALGASSGAGEDIAVVPLTNLIKLAIPPLFVSSLPRRAIGFSFPRGAEGKILGVSMIVATAAVCFLAEKAVGLVPALALVWLMGGMGVVMLYNSTRRGLAFVKGMCAGCRLSPIIVEHETMHLRGISSEEQVWAAARDKYTYEGLGLGTDPKIHSFCPIAKRLKETS